MAVNQRSNVGLFSGWVAGQDDWGNLMNLNLRLLDSLVQSSVLDVVNEPPAAPDDGDLYQVDIAPTGAFAGEGNNLARWDGEAEGWEFVEPKEGWRVYRRSNGRYRVFKSGAWEVDDAITAAANTLARRNASGQLEVAAPGDDAHAVNRGYANDNYEEKRLNNLAATTDPGASDDSTQGYQVLSRWVNTSTKELWLCLDATEGAAEWAQSTLTLDELGSAALADVQSSPTDTTAGRLMAVGAFGLGRQIVSSEANADNYTDPGTYISVSGGHINFPPRGNNNRAIIVVSGGNSYTSQTVYQVTDNRVWTRAAADLAGADWVEVFNTGNILGTVSQSSGVPTGAIIESDSNSDGEYTKFADGTLICTKTVSFTGEVSSPLGSLFISDNINLGAYPTSRTGVDSVHFFVRAASSNAPLWFGVGTGGISTSWPNGWIIAAVARNDPINYAVVCTMIGRWY